MSKLQHLSIIISSDLNTSSVKSQNLTQAKKHKTSTISTQQSLKIEIIHLKQKAHQSFMQVIQIQQLHEQQVESLREQYRLKCQQYDAIVNELNDKIIKMQKDSINLDKNYKHHLYQIEKDSLFGNIQPINFQNQQSKLDDSSILNFQEIIDIHGHKDKVSSIKEQLIKEISMVKGTQKIKNLVQKLLQYVTHLNKQLISLHQSHLKLKSQSRIQQKTIIKQQQPSKIQSKIKQDYDNILKQNKFITDKLKQLSTQKLKNQRLILEKQKLNNKLSQNYNKIINYLHNKGIEIEQLLHIDNMYNQNKNNQDNSLDLNQFIEEALTKKITGRAGSKIEEQTSPATKDKGYNKVETGVIKRLRNTQH